MVYRVIYILVVLIGLISCNKDAEIISDNDAPYYDGIPTVLLENYVNRLYIDLIGREPLDEEMNTDVEFLRANEITVEIRDSLIYKLQFSTIFIEGDSSYKKAYFHRLYEMFKVRLLEGASNAYINSRAGSLLHSYQIDSIAGNMVEANKKLLAYNNLNDIIASEAAYTNGVISINEMHRRMIYNSVYDQINMNTFNFINAVFDNLLFRYPSTYEFDECYKMIEDNTNQTLFFQSGSTKYDMTVIVTESSAFAEGLVNWSYITLLGREANASERDKLVKEFAQHGSFQKMQRSIMTLDEYAHF